jgi:hypothetical protein
VLALGRWGGGRGKGERGERGMGGRDVLPETHFGRVNYCMVLLVVGVSAMLWEGLGVW